MSRSNPPPPPHLFSPPNSDSPATSLARSLACSLARSQARTRVVLLQRALGLGPGPSKSAYQAIRAQQHAQRRLKPAPPAGAAAQAFEAPLGAGGMCRWVGWGARLAWCSSARQAVPAPPTTPPLPSPPLPSLQSSLRDESIYRAPPAPPLLCRSGLPRFVMIEAVEVSVD